MAVAEQNHTDVVRERILEKLIHAEYMPGHAFKLREMTQDSEFKGLSQTPIREALLQLVAKDILVGQRGFTVRVPMPTVAGLAEVRSIRIQLEIMAATAGMQDWTPQGTDRLEQIHSEMLQAKAVGDVATILRKNVQFHFALYGQDRMPYLLSLLRSLWAITGPSIRFLYEEGRPMDVSGHHAHADVIQAMRTQDRALLAKAIAQDGSEHGKKILQVLKEKVSPEALTVQSFQKMELLRTRAKRGRKIQGEQ